MYALKNPHGQGYLEHNPAGTTGLFLGLTLAAAAAFGVGMATAKAATVRPSLPRPGEDPTESPTPEVEPGLQVGPEDLEGVFDARGTLSDVQGLRDRAVLPLAVTILERNAAGVPNESSFPLITEAMPPLAMALRPERLSQVMAESASGASGINEVILALGGALPLQYVAATADGSVSMQIDTDELLALGIGIPSDQLAEDILVADGSPVSAIQQVLNLKTNLDPRFAEDVAKLAQYYVVNKNFNLDEPGPTRDEFILAALNSLAKDTRWIWKDILMGRVESPLLADVVRGVSLVGQLVYQIEVNRASLGG